MQPDPYAQLLDSLRQMEALVLQLAKHRVVRVLWPEEWTSTEKLDISFHVHSENCHTSSEGESSVCEITDEELSKAYRNAWSRLEYIRFMMGVPDAPHEDDEGVETYEEAKARADAYKMRFAR